jgi:hypothetical protein
MVQAMIRSGRADQFNLKNPVDKIVANKKAAHNSYAYR